MKKLICTFLAALMLLSVCAFASGEASGEGSGEVSSVMSEDIEARITAALYLDGVSGEQDASGVTYTATAMDQSCVYAKNGTVYTLTGAVLDKPEGILSTATSFTVPTGEVLWNTTDAGSTGINSVALAWGEGTVLTLRNCTLTSFHNDENGETIGDDERLIGINGAMATYYGRMVLDNVEIIAAGEGGHGIDATGCGEFELHDCTLITYGKKASGLTTDQPGGDIYAYNVSVLTHKSGSAAVYCDGNSYVLVDGGTLESVVEPAAVVCTDGVLELNDVTLYSHEDAALNAHFSHSSPSRITCTGCSFTSDSTSAVTTYANTEMVFDDCEFYPAEGAYIAASVEGENSSGQMETGTGSVTTKNCTLEGGFRADTENGAGLELTLQNTEWTVMTKSVLTALTVDADSAVNGIVTVDGEVTDVSAGGTWTGMIVVSAG